MLDSAVNETAACLVLKTNAVPSVWWSKMLDLAPELLAPLQRAIARPDFLTGCALNLLFDFSSMTQSLRSAVGMSYVAVHMRLGDGHLKNHRDKIVNATRAKIRAAVLCARSVGERLFAGPWSVFFASDSLAARRYALDLNVTEGVNISLNRFDPMHSDNLKQHKNQVLENVWRQWGDLLTILGAQGLVSAGDTHASGEAGLFTQGISDYSQIPAQYLFMPFSRQRFLTGSNFTYDCTPMTPEDLHAII